MVIVGAGPGGAGGGGLRAPPRGSTCWCSRAPRRAGRPGPARASRTTSASPPASPGRRWPGARSRRPRSSAPRWPSAARAVRLDCDSRPYRLHLADGEVVRTRTDRHRHRRALPQAGAARRCRASRAPASSTAPRTSRRSSATARRSPSSAAATRPGRRRSSCRSIAAPRPRAGARPGPGRQHVALPHPAHRGHAQHHAAHAHRRSTRSRATSGLERVRWRHVDTGAQRDARRSATCS